MRQHLESEEVISTIQEDGGRVGVRQSTGIAAMSKSAPLSQGMAYICGRSPRANFVLHSYSQEHRVAAPITGPTFAQTGKTGEVFLLYLKARLNPPTGFCQVVQLDFENYFSNMGNVYLHCIHY